MTPRDLLRVFQLARKSSPYVKMRDLEILAIVNADPEKNFGTSELAEATQIDLGSVSRSLSNLEKMGVARRKRPNAGRSISVVVTPKGARLLTAMMAETTATDL